MLVTTPVKFIAKQQNNITDSSAIEFRTFVKQHYDSISAPKKIVDNALDDAFLEANVKVITEDNSEDSIINIGEIKGKAMEGDYEWLLFKIKKAALLNGANSIQNLHTIHYDNSGSIWRLITRKNDTDSPPIRRVSCTCNAVFVKENRK